MFDNIKIPYFIKTENFYLFIVLSLSIFFCFWRLGDHSLEEWDESRYGLNAYEMIQNRDFVNYYYEGEPDQWNAKPPLSIWLIALSYKIFGFNEFALRFPSAVAGVLIFVTFFYLLLHFRSLKFALISCLILMSTKAIVGSHVARTGDMDALFILFCLLSVYFMFRYLKGDDKSIFLSALFLGLSFYTKGFAFLLILPGIILYLILSKEFLKLASARNFWFSIVLFGSIVFSWFLLSELHGVNYNNAQFAGQSNWENMWKYDIIERFFNNDFGDGERNLTFVIKNIDVKFNLWNYIFYAVLVLLFVKYKNKLNDLMQDKLLLFSLCVIASMSLILTISANKLPWYISPMIPFVTIITVDGIYLIRRNIYFKSTILILLVFTIIRQFLIIDTVKPDRGVFLKSNRQKIESCSKLFISENLPQDIKLYSYWFNDNVIHFNNNTEINSCYLLNYKIPGEKENCYDNFCLYTN